MICGTSTGGIVATLVGLLKQSPASVGKLYDELGKEVFGKGRSFWSQVWNGHFYDPKTLEKAVKNLLGNTQENTCMNQIPPRVDQTPHVRVYLLFPIIDINPGLLGGSSGEHSRWSFMGLHQL